VEHQTTAPSEETKKTGTKTKKKKQFECAIDSESCLLGFLFPAVMIKMMAAIV
jgi:hypothetical protein